MTDLAAARSNMVDSQVRTADVTDLRIQDAMLALPREDFVPKTKAYLAYSDAPLEYAPGRALLKPRDVAKLLQAVKPVVGEKALAIAAPYAAAVLSHMGVDVVRLDGDDLTAAPAGDFDLIVVEGAVGKAPDAWLKALGQGGRMALVERDGPVGKACLYVRTADGLGRRVLFDATPPILAGYEISPGFAF
jgi:protein-L-isoaspartate(D-aspartate) O-methyltransferase